MQKYPAVQIPVGAGFAEPAQYFPGRQSIQKVESLAPSNGLYWPLGQDETAVVPANQNPPAGHIIPVIPSVGSGLIAPSIQKKPESQ